MKTTQAVIINLLRGLIAMGFLCSVKGQSEEIVKASAETSGGTVQRSHSLPDVERERIESTAYAFVLLPPGKTLLGVSRNGVVLFHDDEHYYKWHSGELTRLEPVRDEYEDDESHYSYAHTEFTLGPEGSIAILTVEDRMTRHGDHAFDVVTTYEVVVWPGTGGPAWKYSDVSSTISDQFTDMTPPVTRTYTSNFLSGLHFSDDGALHGLRIAGIVDSRWEMQLFRIDADGGLTTGRRLGTLWASIHGVDRAGRVIGEWQADDGTECYFVGNSEVSYRPIAISPSGDVIALENDESWIYWKDGSRVRAPAPADELFWDLQDRLHRRAYGESGIRNVLLTRSGSAGEWVAQEYQPIDMPAPWRTQDRSAPGTTIPVAGMAKQDGQPERPFLVIPARLRVDADRDGSIALGDESDSPDLEYVRKGLPWFFWLNDDRDVGEADDPKGADIPGQAAGNGADATVNGMRDLVDFFPVHLDISALVQAFPPESPEITYRLRQADNAARVAITHLTPEAAGSYHDDVLQARVLSEASIQRLTAEGVVLEPDFLAGIVAENKGVVLVEACERSHAPLELVIQRGAETVATVTLPVSFDGVETMFRHVSLTGAVGIAPRFGSRGGAPNWSPELENDQAFVFVHGYNVNQRQARGWQAEVFKRLWWSGSQARFWGITWFGAESQIPLAGASPDYQSNVVNAFATAPQFAEFVTELRQVAGVTEVNVAAHSLGNLVVSSAISDYGANIDRYFLINAALPAESYDSTEAETESDTAVMPHTDWTRELGVYPPVLWATNWWKLFDANDARSRLTWRDRFPLQPDVEYFDFFSSGEEVLATDAGRTPKLGGVLLEQLDHYLREALPLADGAPPGTNAWAYQEKLKGRLFSGRVVSSNFGGWGFNRYHFERRPTSRGRGPKLISAVLTPAEATALLGEFTPEVLRNDPFFRPGGRWQKLSTWMPQPDGSSMLLKDRLGELYDETGSVFAERHHASLLARMIPSMSNAAGRVAVEVFDVSAEQRNVDMNGLVQPATWPSTRGNDDWRHSDLTAVGLPHVRELYRLIVARLQN